jgi:hypothetical protein
MSTRSNITIRPARLSDLIHLTRLDLAANSNHPLIALSFPYPFQRTATTVPRILLRAKGWAANRRQYLRHLRQSRQRG